MKKILSGIVAIGLMATSAMALTGPVNKVTVKADGTKKVTIGTTTKQLTGDAEAVKAMLAMALTAQSTDAQVEAFHDGTSWTFISVQSVQP